MVISLNTRKGTSKLTNSAWEFRGLVNGSEIRSEGKVSGFASRQMLVMSICFIDSLRKIGMVKNFVMLV